MCDKTLKQTGLSDDNYSLPTRVIIPPSYVYFIIIGYDRLNLRPISV